VLLLLAAAAEWTSSCNYCFTSDKHGAARGEYASGGAATAAAAAIVVCNSVYLTLFLQVYKLNIVEWMDNCLL